MVLNLIELSQQPFGGGGGRGFVRGACEVYLRFVAVAEPDRCWAYSVLLALVPLQVP